MDKSYFDYLDFKVDETRPMVWFCYNDGPCCAKPFGGVLNTKEPRKDDDRFELSGRYIGDRFCIHSNVGIPMTVKQTVTDKEAQRIKDEEWGKGNYMFSYHPSVNMPFDVKGYKQNRNYDYGDIKTHDNEVVSYSFSNKGEVHCIFASIYDDVYDVFYKLRSCWDLEELLKIGGGYLWFFGSILNDICDGSKKEIMYNQKTIYTGVIDPVPLDQALNKEVVTWKDIKDTALAHTMFLSEEEMEDEDYMADQIYFDKIREQYNWGKRKDRDVTLEALLKGEFPPSD